MKRIPKLVAYSLVALGLVVYGSTSSLAVPGGGPGPIGGELRGIMQFTGKVVCVDCRLSDVQQAHPELANLYLLTHVGDDQQQAVMEITGVSEPQRWNAIVFPAEVLIRSTNEVFHKLTAEQNLYKTVQVTGLLRTDRVMDVSDVTVSE
ncbi:MAG: hypothetical protein AB7G75_20005 [Candidatus Binatia bacterium]